MKIFTFLLLFFVMEVGVEGWAGGQSVFLTDRNWRVPQGFVSFFLKKKTRQHFSLKKKIKAHVYQ